MMKKLLLTASVCLLSATAYMTPIQAEEAKTGMTQAQMQKMMKLSTPGEGHKALEKLVGNWTYKMSYRMSADSPEQFTEGSSENRMILGGRHLEQKASGVVEEANQTYQFEGIGFTGYDNLKKEYTSVWIDNMGTGTAVSKGAYDAKTETFTETGNHTCAMRGKDVKFRSELKIVDKDHYTLTMYDISEEKSYKSMEIQYTRK